MRLNIFLDDVTRHSCEIWLTETQWNKVERNRVGYGCEEHHFEAKGTKIEILKTVR